MLCQRYQSLLITVVALVLLKPAHSLSAESEDPHVYKQWNEQAAANYDIIRKTKIPVPPS